MELMVSWSADNILATRISIEVHQSSSATCPARFESLLVPFEINDFPWWGKRWPMVACTLHTLVVMYRMHIYYVPDMRSGYCFYIDVPPLHVSTHGHSLLNNALANTEWTSCKFLYCTSGRVGCGGSASAGSLVTNSIFQFLLWCNSTSCMVLWVGWSTWTEKIDKIFYLKITYWCHWQVIQMVLQWWWYRIQVKEGFIRNHKLNVRVQWRTFAAK